MVIPHTHTQTYSQEWADGIVAVLFREFGRNMMPGCFTLIGWEWESEFCKDTTLGCHQLKRPSNQFKCFKSLSVKKLGWKIIIGITEPLCQTHLLGKVAWYHFFALDPVDCGHRFLMIPLFGSGSFSGDILGHCCSGNKGLNHLALSGAHVTWKGMAQAYGLNGRWDTDILWYTVPSIYTMLIFTLPTISKIFLPLLCCCDSLGFCGILLSLSLEVVCAQDWRKEMVGLWWTYWCSLDWKHEHRHGWK